MVLKIKTGEDICKHVLIIENSHGVGHKDSKKVNSEKWVSVDSLLKLSPEELIEEVRELHIQKSKELEEEE